jgi:hypothetical protein
VEAGVSVTENGNVYFIKTDFDPSEIALLNESYEKARKSLHDKGQPAIVNEIIAERIIALARGGELDPNELCAGALSALGNKTVFE